MAELDLPPGFEPIDDPEATPPGFEPLPEAEAVRETLAPPLQPTDTPPAALGTGQRDPTAPPPMLAREAPPAPIQGSAIEPPVEKVLGPSTNKNLDAYRATMRNRADRLGLIFRAMGPTQEGPLQKEAGVLELMKQTGMSKDMAQSLYPEVASMRRAGVVDPELWDRTNPGLADILLKRSELAPTVTQDKPINALQKAFNWWTGVRADGIEALEEATGREVGGGILAGPSREERLSSIWSITAPQPFTEKLTDIKKAAGEAKKPPEKVAVTDDEFAKQVREAPEFSIIGGMLVPKDLLVAGMRGSERWQQQKKSRSYLEWSVAQTEADLAKTGAEKARAAGAESIADFLELEAAGKEARANALMQEALDIDYHSVNRDYGEGEVGKVLRTVAEGAASTGVGLEKGIPLAVVTGAAAYGGTLAVTKNPAAAARVATGFASITGKLGAVGGTFQQEYGSSLEGFLKTKTESGKPMDSRTARVAALVYATIAAGVEFASWGPMLAAFGPIGEVVKRGELKAYTQALMKTPTFMSALKAAGKSIGLGGFSEGGEEVLQEGFNQGVGYAARSYTAGHWEQKGIKGDEILAAGWEGMIGGWGLAGLGGVVHLGTVQMEIDKVHANAGLISDLTGLADSPTTRGAPDAVAQMVIDHAAKGGTDASTVFLDTPETVRLFQEANVDVNEAATQLLGPDGPQRLQQALAQGTRLELSMKEYLEKVGPTPLAEKLVPHTSLSATAPTLDQLSKRDEHIAEALKGVEAGAPAETEGEQAYLDATEEQLAKLPKEDAAKARKKISIIRAHIRTAFARNGEAANDVFHRFALEAVQGDEAASVGDSPLAQQGETTGNRSLDKIRSEFHALTPEEQTGRLYRDTNTGLLSEHGLAIAPVDPANSVEVEFDIEGKKLINDKFSHKAFDDVMRRAAGPLRKSGLVAGQRGGSLVVRASSLEHGQDLARQMEEALGGKFKVTPTGLKTAARERGEFSHRSSPPVAFLKNPGEHQAFGRAEEARKAKAQLAPAEAEMTRAATERAVGELKQYVDEMAATPEGLPFELGDHNRTAFPGAEKAFETLHRTKEGLLTGEGFHAAQRLNKKDHTAVLDARGFGDMRTIFGDEGLDYLAEEFSRTLAEIAADNTPEDDVARPHSKGDEFFAQGDNDAEMKDVYAELKRELQRRVFFLEKSDGSVALQEGLHFAYGLGTDLHSAEQDLGVAKREQDDRNTVVPPRVVTAAEWAALKPGFERTHVVLDVGRAIEARRAAGSAGETRSESGARGRLEQSQVDRGSFVDDASHPVSVRVRQAEGNIRNLKHERAVAVDEAGNVLIEQAGGRSNVVFTAEQINTLVDSGTATFTHNHPSGRTLSIEDITIASVSNLKEIRAVTPSGLVYRIVRPEGGWVGQHPDLRKMRWKGLPDGRAVFVGPPGLDAGAIVAAMKAYEKQIKAADRKGLLAATAEMDRVILEAGGRLEDGRNAQGFSEEAWGRIASEQAVIAINEAARREGWGWQIDTLPGDGARAAEAGRLAPGVQEAGALGVAEPQEQYGPKWFSAAEEAVVAAKQEKNTPSAWLALIEKTPGVKKEEVDFLGLREWLGEQKGSITKAQVKEFIQSHRIEVKETSAEGAQLERAQEAYDNAIGRWTVGEGMVLGEDGDELWYDQGRLDKWEKAYGDNDEEQLPGLPSRADVDKAVRMQEEEQNAIEAAEDDAERAMKAAREGEFNRAFSFARDAVSTARDYGNEDVWNPLMYILEDIKESESTAHYENYTLGGHEKGSYRELLLYAPGRTGGYTSSHFGKAGKGLLAHARTSEHKGADGQPLLLVEEIQSDLHQAARDKGYERRGPDKTREAQDAAFDKRTLARQDLTRYLERGISQRSLINLIVDDYQSGRNDGKTLARIDGLGPVGNEAYDAGRADALAGKSHAATTSPEYTDGYSEGKFIPDVERLGRELRQAQVALDAAERSERRARRGPSNRLPNAPFKNTWDELVAKRLIRMAAEGGYKHLAWTTGEQQAERYNLAKHVDEIRLTPYLPGSPAVEAGGKFHMTALKEGRAVVSKDLSSDAEVADVVGKELAQKLIAGTADNTTAQLTGQDLQLGGEGMKSFYDRRIPSIFDKLVKKFGGKVEKTKIGTPGVSFGAMERANDPRGGWTLNRIDNEGVHPVEIFDTREAAQHAAAVMTREAGQSEVWSVTIPDALRDVALSKGFAVFEPQDKYRPARFSTADLRGGRETLEQYGLPNVKIDPATNRPVKGSKGKGRQGFNIVRDIYIALQEHQREVLKKAGYKNGRIARNDHNDKARDLIAGGIADVILEELRPENIGESGAGWYGEKYRSALASIAEMFPELKTSATAQAKFTAMVAITSNGNYVVENYRLATRLYGKYRETGKLPTKGIDSKRSKQMHDAFKSLDAYVAHHGEEALYSQEPGGLLYVDTVAAHRESARASGYDAKLSGFGSEEKVPLSSLIIGPKIGTFFGNLMGLDGFLTMDMWAMRTVNTMRGDVLTSPKRGTIERVKKMMDHPHRFKEGMDQKQKKALLDSLPASKMTDAQVFKEAVRLERIVRKEKNYGKKFTKGPKKGKTFPLTQVEKAANELWKQKYEKLNESPTNTADRAFIISAFTKARDMLREQGVDLDIADLQAISWFYEQRLVRQLGGKVKSDVSFEEVASAVRLAHAEGREVTDADVAAERNRIRSAAGTGAQTGRGLQGKQDRGAGKAGPLGHSLAELAGRLYVDESGAVKARPASGLPVGIEGGLGPVSASMEETEPERQARIQRALQVKSPTSKYEPGVIPKGRELFKKQRLEQFPKAEENDLQQSIHRVLLDDVLRSGIDQVTVNTLDAMVDGVKAQLQLLPKSVQEKIAKGVEAQGPVASGSSSVRDTKPVMMFWVYEQEATPGVTHIPVGRTKYFQTLAEAEAYARERPVKQFKTPSERVDHPYYTGVTSLNFNWDALLSSTYGMWKDLAPEERAELQRFARVRSQAMGENTQRATEGGSRIRQWGTHEAGYAEQALSDERGDMLGDKRKGKGPPPSKNLPGQASKEAQLTALTQFFRLEQFDPRLESTDDKGVPRGYTNLDLSAEGQKLFTIALNKNADLSTFLHESGHIFLKLFSMAATHEKASQQTKDDYAAALKWLGAESFEKLTRAQHEKWATGFERYLREGNAPSAKLVGAFEAFRLWLTDVYRSITGLARLADINDEVRGIFDRLLATDDEISAQKNAMGIAIPMSREILGMTPEQYTEYLEKQKKLFGQANLRAALAVIKDKARENEAWWKEKMKEELKAAEAEYELIPARMAQQTLLGKGEVWGGTTTSVVLQRDEVIAAVGEELAKKFKTSKEGASADELIDLFPTFKTGAQMLDAIAHLPEKDVWTKGLATQQMAEKHPGLLDDRVKLRQMVSDGLHGAETEQWLARESAALTVKVPGAVMVPDDVIKSTARKLVGERLLSKLDPGNALAGERAAANEAVREAAKGNLKAALIAKNRQRLQMHLWRELTDAVEDREKLKDLAGEMSSRKGRERLGQGHPVYLAGSDLILETLGFKKESPREEPLPSLGEVVQQLMDDDADPSFDEKVLSRALRGAEEVASTSSKLKPWQHLNVAEMREAIKALKNIKSAARDRATIEHDGKKIAVEFAEKELVTDGEAHLPPLPPLPTKEADTNWQGFKRRWNSFDGSMRKQEFMLTRLAGGVEKFIHSPWFQYIIRPLQAAKHAEADLLKKFAPPIIEAFRKMPSKRAMEMIDGRALLPTHRQDIAVPQRRFEWLILLLNAGNESNLSRLQEGRGITEEQLREGSKTLGITKEETDWAQAIIDTYEELGHQSFDLEEEMTGVRPEKIEARPFVMEVVMPDGTTQTVAYKGGYFPAVYDPDYTQVGAKQELKSFMDRTLVRPGTSKGHLKSRVPGFSDVISTGTATISRHLVQVIHDLAYRKAIKSTSTLIMRPAVQKVLRERLGIGWAKTFEQWLRDIGQMRGNDGDVRVAEAMKFVRWAKGNLPMVALGYSIQNAMEDFTTNFTAALPGSGFNAKHLAAGVAEVMSRGIGAMEEAEADSGELRARRDQIHRDFLEKVARLTQSNIPGRDQLRWLKDHAFVFSTMVDRFSSAAIFLGAQRQYQAEHAEDENQDKVDRDAVLFGEAMVRKLLLSHSVVDASAMMRDRGYLGTFLTFFGYFNHAYNRQMGIVDQIIDSKEFRKRAMLAGGLLGFVFASSVISGLVRGQGPGPGDEPEDEDEEKWKALKKWRNYTLRKMLMGELEMFPGIGTAAQGAEAWYLGDKQAGVRNNSVVGMAEEMAKSIMRAKNPDQAMYARVIAGARVAATLLGLPAAQFLKMLGYVWPVLEGDETPRGPFDVAGGLIHGRKTERKGTNVPTLIQDVISGPPPL